MKRKLWLLGLILLTIINLAALGTWIYHRYHRQTRPDYHAHRATPTVLFCRELNLSAEQMEKVQQLRRTFHQSVGPASQTLLNKRLALIDQLILDHPDTSQINQLIQEIADSQIKLQHQVARYITQEKQILKPEQQQRFFEILKARLLREARYHGAQDLNLMPLNCRNQCDSSQKCTEPKERR
ncbi:periplasmic heavy metal sensor [candidate division KSB1 bacterium]|nr:periplasmic heavy metal sensor [candidate division KSB1 bacterium]